MEQLTIVGTEDEMLVLATDSGQRFALPVDDVLRAESRRMRREREAAEPRPPLPSPREIQAHIRSGLSAREVAELLDAPVEDIKRFEGPVLAEREHVVEQALAVPVLMGVDLEQDENPTFGQAIRTKLDEVTATEERWTSWKDDKSGWIIKLEFTASEVQHDARWSFDPRRSALAPLNADATQLSRQGPLPEGLIPRLRALDSVPPKDNSSFDAEAFGPRKLAEVPPPAPEPAVEEAAGAHEDSPVRDAATNRAENHPATNPDTADLLEALRRRRGQRESAPAAAEEPDQAPVALFDAFEPAFEETAEEASPAEDDSRAGDDDSPRSDQGRRRGRAAMPSWDEIVFGARGDD